MKIQIVSDLHLEFAANRQWLEENPLVPRGDLLLIAGDSNYLNHLETGYNFMNKISKDFPFIISIPGNHEFYGSQIEPAYPSYRYLISENHLCLNNEVYIHKGIRILCTVLWSKVPDIYSQDVGTRLNDYRHIGKNQPDGSTGKLRIEDSNAYHDVSMQFILNALAKPFAGRTILLTHHLPSYQCVPLQFRGSRLVSGFATDLDGLIIAHPQISHWVYGHAHDFHQQRVGETMLIRNPLGYVEQGDHRDFRRDFYIEV